VTSTRDSIPPTVIFLHLTKTAGTTLAHVAQQQYQAGRFLRTDYNFDRFRDRLALMSDAERRAIDCLFGHMAFGLHRFLPRPVVYATMLREPVDRVISHYYYALHAADHPLHRQVVDARMTAEDYVVSGILDELNDGQVRRLAAAHPEDIPYGAVPREVLETAKRNLRDHFVVGLTERFDASLLLFGRALGWTKLNYVSLNVTPGRLSRSGIPASLRRLIEKYNALDTELYEYAQELFNAQLSRYHVTPATIIGFRLNQRSWDLRRRIARIASPRRAVRALSRLRGKSAEHRGMFARNVDGGNE
jgi:Sulfotransferase family